MTPSREVLAWWLLSVSIWMLSLSAYTAAELVAAVLAGLPCALTAIAARRAVRGSWRPGRGWLAALRALPLAIARDSVVVLLLPWTRRRVGAGGLREIDLQATGESSAANGRRALSILLLSASPGSYVVDADPIRGTALVHAVSAPSSLERAVVERTVVKRTVVKPAVTR